MKPILNLEEYGVIELSYSECQSIDGGLSEVTEAIWTWISYRLHSGFRNMPFDANGKVNFL